MADLMSSRPPGSRTSRSARPIASTSTPPPRSSGPGSPIDPSRIYLGLGLAQSIAALAAGSVTRYRP